MLNYQIVLELDEATGAYLVDCPDIPEMHSVGDDEDEALLNARDALEGALELYQETRRPIPLPAPPPEGSFTVTLPVALSLKVLLHNEMSNRACVKQSWRGGWSGGYRKWSGC